MIEKNVINCIMSSNKFETMSANSWYSVTDATSKKGECVCF